MYKFAGAVCASLLVHVGSVFADFDAAVPPDIPSVNFEDGDFAWRSRARVFIGHDDNVQLYNDYLGQTGTGGLTGGISVDLVGEKLLEGGLSFGGALRFDYQGYSGTPSPAFPNSDFNHYIAQASTFVRHRSETADGSKVTWLALYGFNKTEAENWGGITSDNHQLLARVDYDTVGPWSFFAHARVNFADYNILLADPLSDRDSTFTEILGSVTHDFGSAAGQGVFLKSLSAALGWQDNDADGANWAYDGYIVSASAGFGFSPTVTGDVMVSYADRDFVGNFTSQGFLAPGRLNQQITTVEGRLFWQIRPSVIADIGVKHESIDSNSFQFTADRTYVYGGLTFGLH